MRQVGDYDPYLEMTHLNVGGGLIHQHVHVLVDFASEPEWTFRRPSQRSSQRDTIASTETVEAPSSNASLVEAAWITRCGRRGVEACKLKHPVQRP